MGIWWFGGAVNAHITKVKRREEPRRRGQRSLRSRTIKEWQSFKEEEEAAMERKYLGEGRISLLPKRRPSLQGKPNLPLTTRYRIRSGACH